MPDPIYVTDAKGERWRVHDCAFGPPHAKPGMFKRLPLGNPRASYRYFVNAVGERWAFRFRNDDSVGNDRSTEPDVLLEQRRRAEFVGRTSFDARERGPR